MEQKLGKASATMMHLLSKYENKKDYPYHVFMDNLFTTVPLLEVLDANGYHGPETVRVNQLGKSCLLADTADFKRTERGSMRSVQTIIASSFRNCCIRLIQWLDNGVVTLASSVFGINPQSKSKRWLKIQKKKMLIF